MKRFAALAVVSFALVGIVAIANRVRRKRPAQGETWEESKTGYAEKVHGQLEEWEGQLDEFRQRQRQFDSIDNYMVMDDLELLMKDVRGDLSKLLAKPTDNQSPKGELKWNTLRSGIEGKMSRLKRTLHRSRSPKSVVPPRTKSKDFL